MVYKVCQSSRYDTANILSSFDDAIAHGVDILSVSIGGEVGNHHSIFRDSFFISSFHAMKNGVLTVFAAGNEKVNCINGPQPDPLDNCSPWSIVVCAATIDGNLGNNPGKPHI